VTKPMKENPATGQANGAYLYTDNCNSSTKLELSRTFEDVVMGEGQYQKDDFSTLTLQTIRDLVDNPQQVDKAKAQWLIPSTLMSRTFREQEDHGSFWYLWADIDDNPPTINHLASLLRKHLICDYEIYTSRSATEDKQKSRIIIPLSESCCGADWVLIQECLNDWLVSHDITSDRSSERAGQLCYLPNRGAYYKSDYQRDGSYFSPLLFFKDAFKDKKSAIVQAERELQQKREAAKHKREQRKAAGHDSIIDEFNALYLVEDILAQAGYEQKGNKFRHPESESGSYSASIKDGRVNSLSSSDRLYNNGEGAHDAFSAFDVLFHSSDQKKAMKDAGDQWLSINGESWNKVKQREHMQSNEGVSVHDFENLDKSAKQINETAFVLPDYPEELLNLPYQLGELQVFILNRMTYPSVATAGITALSSLTAFAQTNITIKSRDGLGLNEYYMVLAPTGFGKEDLRKPAEILDYKSQKLITAESSCREGAGHLVGLNNVSFRHSAPASAQGIHQILEYNRSTFFLSDEFAEWLRLSHKDSTKQAALGYLMQAYTKALSIIEPGHAVTNKYEPVKNPRLSILATSTSEALFATMTREQADSGAYNRWVMFVGEQELPQKLYDGLVYEPEDDLVEFIAWVKMQPEETVVTFNKESFAEYKKIDQELAEPIKRKDALLGGRLGEQSIKIAALVALSDKRFVMSASDIKTAFNIRVGLYRRSAAVTAQEGNMGGLHSTGQAFEQVSAIFEKSSLVYKSQLRKKSRKYAKLSVSEQKAVIEMLISQGVASQCAQSKAVLVSHAFKGTR
jgi:hypothetical protein